MKSLLKAFRRVLNFFFRVKSNPSTDQAPIESLLFSDLSSDEKIRRILAHGSQRLKLESAAVFEKQGDELVPRFSFGAQATPTYCVHLFKGESRVLAVHYAALSEWRGSPVYRNSGLESYLGVAIDGPSAPGTLCFFSKSGRDQVFSDSEKKFVSTLGNWVSVEWQRSLAQTAKPSGTDHSSCVA